MICLNDCFAMEFLTDEKRISTSNPDFEVAYHIYKCPNCGYIGRKFAYYQKINTKKKGKAR